MLAANARMPVAAGHAEPPAAARRDRPQAGCCPRYGGGLAGAHGLRDRGGV